MQVQLFNIPVFDEQNGLEEMNSFIRGHKVLEITQNFFQYNELAYWSFCIKYLDSKKTEQITKNGKKDIKSLLNKVQFNRFTTLRESRRIISKEDAIPAFAVFTDDELINLSKLDEINLSSMKTIKGIGSKKAEKFGQRIIELFNKKIKDETSGKSDTSNS